MTESSASAPDGSSSLIYAAEPFLARALLVGDRIDVKLLALPDKPRSHPLILPVGGGGMAIVFRYGVVVFFATSERDAEAWLGRLQTAISRPLATPETEQLWVVVDREAKDTVGAAQITIGSADFPRLQLIATALSKSVVLAQYEMSIAATFEQIEPLAVELQQFGRTRYDARQLLRQIGRSLLSQQQLVGRVAIGDKPDLLWEAAELEPFYLRLEDELEIGERYSVLERKLDLASRTAGTILELIHTRQNLRLEWYIVILIVVEIALFVYDLFLRNS